MIDNTQMEKEVRAIHDKAIQKKKDDETIFCPYCGIPQDNDDYQYPVTYWGQEDIYGYECGKCEKTFRVKEFVTRVYETMKAEGDE